MVGRTHDLAAFTTLTLIVASYPLQKMGLGTVIVGVGAAMIGGIAPDIDQPTATLWRRIPAGSIIGRIICPFFGGHRFISHSVIGIVLFSFLAQYGLAILSSVLLVDMTIVWKCFMIGFVSHLVMDTLTREGVPWLFPIPIHFGIPPLQFLRVRTGGIVEKFIVFPILLFSNGYLLYTHQDKFLTFIHSYIK